MFKKMIQIHNWHLILSIVIIVPVGLVYGFNPSLLFDVQLNTIDEKNIFKAVMGIYLAFALFWASGIFNDKYWRVATISNSVFILGLCFGRVLSIFLDGIPSTIFCLGSIGEFILGIFGLYQLKKNQ